MILKQFYLNCLAHASYLIGDEHSGTAAVVDPQRDVDQYVAFAAGHGLEIRHVFLTHFHADFVAGHLELRDRTGATLYLGAAAKAEYQFMPLHDGALIEFGRMRLKALETPGHTPESISIVVFDLDRSGSEPYAVLTGDTAERPAASRVLRRRIPLVNRREPAASARVHRCKRDGRRHCGVGNRAVAGHRHRISGADLAYVLASQTSSTGWGAPYRFGANPKRASRTSFAVSPNWFQKLSGGPTRELFSTPSVAAMWGGLAIDVRAKLAAAPVVQADVVW